MKNVFLQIKDHGRELKVHVECKRFGDLVNLANIWNVHNIQIT